MMRTARLSKLLPFFFAPLLMGSGWGNPGCDADRPLDLDGAWEVSAESETQLELVVDGTSYVGRVPAGGGTAVVEHEGEELRFDIHCAGPVVCPGEVLGDELELEQDGDAGSLGFRPYEFEIETAGQRCESGLTDPDPASCGEGTSNPGCNPVCRGALEKAKQTRSVYAQTELDIPLGGEHSSDGVDCAVLPEPSRLRADVETTGERGGQDWDGTAMDGEVTMAYSGGCLWAGGPIDADLEQRLAAVQVRLSKPFTAIRD